jgi:PAS domain-containing protein
MGLLDSDIRRLLESFPGVIWATDRHLCASIVFGADLDALGLSADDVSGRELAEQLVAERPEVRILFTSGYPADAVLRSGIAHARPLTSRSRTCRTTSRARCARFWTRSRAGAAVCRDRHTAGVARVNDMPVARS